MSALLPKADISPCGGRQAVGNVRAPLAAILSFGSFRVALVGAVNHLLAEGARRIADQLDVARHGRVFEVGEQRVRPSANDGVQRLV